MKKKSIKDDDIKMFINKKISFFVLITAFLCCSISLTYLVQNSDQVSLYVRYRSPFSKWEMTVTNINKINQIERIIEDVAKQGLVYVEPPKEPMIYGRGENAFSITINRNNQYDYYLVDIDHAEKISQQYDEAKDITPDVVYWVYATDETTHDKIDRILNIKDTL